MGFEPGTAWDERWKAQVNPKSYRWATSFTSTTSVTRLGDLLDFGQVFKAFGNNKFAQISHILRQFL